MADRGRILVVDDDPLVLELVTTRLALSGYAPFTARDGFQAIRRLHEVRVKAMVLDLNMPGMDGFGVLAQMGRLGMIEKIPTLVLSARNAREDVAEAVRLGARDYLSKPFDDAQLISRVGRLCARARARPTVRAA